MWGGVGESPRSFLSGRAHTRFTIYTIFAPHTVFTILLFLAPYWFPTAYQPISARRGESTSRPGNRRTKECAIGADQTSGPDYHSVWGCRGGVVFASRTLAPLFDTVATLASCPRPSASRPLRHQIIRYGRYKAFRRDFRNRYIRHIKRTHKPIAENSYNDIS